MTPSTDKHSILDWETWQERARGHYDTLAPLVEGYRQRRAQGTLHPVHDFLFSYYRYPSGKLLQWHPLFNETLELNPNEPTPKTVQQKFYQTSSKTAKLDPFLLRDKDRERLYFSRDLLMATASRPPQFGCYGLHEWAMVYRSNETRHQERAPLRLSQSEITEFVASQNLICTHFDAFRFFTPLATPRNRFSLSLEDRINFEQPGCIHANMDLYKWTFKAMPWLGSELLRENFLLALEFRELDMKASPYDLTDYGYEPITIETSSGRQEYQEQQQKLATRASKLREQIIEALDNLLKASIQA